MRILVAGWHGQVAHALSERTARRTDITAFAVGRPALDLTDNPSVGRSVFGIEPDVIINTAAFTDVDGAEDQPMKAQRQNVIGAANLASDAARREIPIIHLSTAHVFDGEKTAPYCEDDDARPLNSYGRSKLESERCVAAVNPRHVIVRTGWIFSPYGRNFVKSMLGRAGDEGTIDVVADQTGSPTYALHLADALLDLAAGLVKRPDPTLFGIYHAASSGQASWYGVSQRVFEASQRLGGPVMQLRPISHQQYPVGSARANNACLDCDKLKRHFGITLPDWRDGVDDCVQRLLS